MTLSLRLKPDLERRISILAEQQGLTKSAWVRRLIEQTVSDELSAHRKTPFELAEGLGLIGCIEGGSEDLATNAKKYIREKIHAKDSR